MKRAFIFVSALLSLTACTAPQTRVTIIKPNNKSLTLATLQNINTQAHTCWRDDMAFKAYGIIPELDTSGTPRILIVPKGKPQSLPKLVITAKGRTAQTFGPLVTSPLAPRIQSDVSRWSTGATGCNANT